VHFDTYFSMLYLCNDHLESSSNIAKKLRTTEAHY